MSLFNEWAEYVSQQLPVPPHWGGTGATPRYPDRRNRLAVQDPRVRAALAELAPAYDRMQYWKQPYNQGNEGSCVAFSWCGASSIDRQQAAGVWPIYDGHGLYRTLGGSGNSGINSQVCANYVIKNGTPLLSGGSERVIGSYAMVQQAPQTFREQIFACVATNQAVKLALLLPSDFGWQSGHGAITQGYHETVVIGYVRNPDYFIIGNSWGEWGYQSRGIGSVLCDYCEQDGNQHGLCYAELSSSLVLPDPNPPPPPPPPPPPVNSRKIGGTASGVGVSSLAVGQSLDVQGGGFLGKIALTSVEGDGDHNNPPPPPPPPGDLKVIIATQRRGGVIWAQAQDASGQYVTGTASGTVGSTALPARACSRIPAVWQVPGTSGTVTVTVTSANGQNGQGTATL